MAYSERETGYVESLIDGAEHYLRYVRRELPPRPVSGYRPGDLDLAVERAEDAAAICLSLAERIRTRRLQDEEANRG